MRGIPIRFVPVEDPRADAGRHRRMLLEIRKDLVEDLAGEGKVGAVDVDGFDVRVNDPEIDAEGRITQAVARGIKKMFGDAGFELALSGAIVPAGGEIDAAELGL